MNQIKNTHLCQFFFFEKLKIGVPYYHRENEICRIKQNKQCPRVGDMKVDEKNADFLKSKKKWSVFLYHHRHRHPKFLHGESAHRRRIFFLRVAPSVPFLRFRAQ